MKIKNTQNLQNNQKENQLIKVYSKKSFLVKKKILSIDVTSTRKEEILEYIISSIKNSSENYYITTPNPEMVVYASHHPEVQSILNGSRIALCDGIGLYLGAQILGKPLNERFTGVEMVERLCEKANEQLVTIGFFGGRPGVAEKTSECLRKRYPNLKVVFASDTWNDTISSHKADVSKESHEDRKIEKGKMSPTQNKLYTPVIDILFVALGFPKQEEWMASHVHNIPVRVTVGVGGAFDYLSGRVPRAPKWIQNIGFEWLFRLMVQPWRLKRQLALPEFAWMVAKEKFSFSKDRKFL